MRFLLFLFLGFLLFTSCDRTQEEDPIIEEPQMEEEEVISPFEAFLGTWHLESAIYDADTILNSERVMYIEEDDILEDDFAIGYFIEDGSTQQNPFTVEFTNQQDQIIFKTGSLTFDCTYTFKSADNLEIDDTLDSYVSISNWVH